jgi:hypothetical protein
VKVRCSPCSLRCAWLWVALLLPSPSLRAVAQRRQVGTGKQVAGSNRKADILMSLARPRALGVEDDDREGRPIMTLGWGDVSDATMRMLVIIPGRSAWPIGAPRRS